MASRPDGTIGELHSTYLASFWTKGGMVFLVAPASRMTLLARSSKASILSCSPDWSVGAWRKEAGSSPKWAQESELGSKLGRVFACTSAWFKPRRARAMDCAGTPWANWPAALGSVGDTTEPNWFTAKLVPSIPALPPALPVHLGTWSGWPPLNGCCIWERVVGRGDVPGAGRFLGFEADITVYGLNIWPAARDRLQKGNFATRSDDPRNFVPGVGEEFPKCRAASSLACELPLLYESSFSQALRSSRSSFCSIRITVASRRCRLGSAAWEMMALERGGGRRCYAQQPRRGST